MNAQHTPGPFTPAERRFVERMFCNLVAAGDKIGEREVLAAAKEVLNRDRMIARAVFTKDSLRSRAVAYMAPRVFAKTVVKDSLTTEAIGQFNRAMFECISLEGRQMSSIVARAAIAKATGSAT